MFIISFAYLQSMPVCSAYIRSAVASEVQRRWHKDCGLGHES